MLLRLVYPVTATDLPLAPGFKKKPRLRSLHKFVDATPHDWAVRFYSGKMAVEDAKTLAGKKYKLINLPHYLAGKLDVILDNIIK